MSILESWKSVCLKDKKLTLTDFNKFVESSESCVFLFSEDTCFCKKLNESTVEILYSKNNKIKSHKCISKKEFFKYVNNFNTIIVKDFVLNLETFSNKNILRYEVLNNFLTNNNTHYISDTLYSSKNNFDIFLSKDLDSLIKKDLDFFKFASFLLNHFESGSNYNTLVVKPKINLSSYGRWYWTSSFPIQNNKKNKNYLFNILLDNGGVVVNIDLVSGEPIVFSQLTDSSVLQNIIKYRNIVKKKEPELSSAIKNMLNVFIHANYSSLKDQKQISRLIKTDMIEKAFNVPILDLFAYLQDEFMCYNNKILESYKSDFMVKERKRNIFNPLVPIMTDNKIIKEHRKYLQGHVHDKILDLAKRIHEEFSVLPLFTIHDSLSYYSQDLELPYKLKEVCSSELTTIEILKK